MTTKRKFSVSVEQEETTGERHVRLINDVVLFIVAISAVVLIAWLCYSTLSAANTTAEEKKWAMSVLSAVTGGIIGYLVHK
jgi:hypothetical protein